MPWKVFPNRRLPLKSGTSKMGPMLLEAALSGGRPRLLCSTDNVFVTHRVLAKWLRLNLSGEEMLHLAEVSSGAQIPVASPQAVVDISQGWKSIGHHNAAVSYRQDTRFIRARGPKVWSSPMIHRGKCKSGSCCWNSPYEASQSSGVLSMAARHCGFCRCPPTASVFSAEEIITLVACQRYGTTHLPRAWDHLRILFAPHFVKGPRSVPGVPLPY